MLSTQTQNVKYSVYLFNLVSIKDRLRIFMQILILPNIAERNGTSMDNHFFDRYYNEYYSSNLIIYFCLRFAFKSPISA